MRKAVWEGISAFVMAWKAQASTRADVTAVMEETKEAMMYITNSMTQAGAVDAADPARLVLATETVGVSTCTGLWARGIHPQCWQNSLIIRGFVVHRHQERTQVRGCSLHAATT